MSFKVMKKNHEAPYTFKRLNNNPTTNSQKNKCKVLEKEKQYQRFLVSSLKRERERFQLTRRVP